jgi:hypothetical protein
MTAEDVLRIAQREPAMLAAMRLVKRLQREALFAYAMAIAGWLSCIGLALTK